MTRFAIWVRRSPLFAYFGLVFGAEWLLFFALRSTALPLVALFIGSWLPNVIGVLVTGITGRWAGLRELFGRVVLWRIGFRWYAITLLGPIAVAFLALGLYALSGNALPEFAPAEMILPLILGNAILGPLGEELGWRGTALPRLQARWNVLISSLILGVLWGLYHLPAFLMPGMPQQDIALIAFMLGVVPFNVFISWVFNHTHGSLIPAFLSHLAFNFVGNATGVFGDVALFWLVVGVWWVVAIAIVVVDWARFTRLAAVDSRIDAMGE